MQNGKRRIVSAITIHHRICLEYILHLSSYSSSYFSFHLSIYLPLFCHFICNFRKVMIMMTIQPSSSCNYNCHDFNHIPPPPPHHHRHHRNHHHLAGGEVIESHSPQVLVLVAAPPLITRGPQTTPRPAHHVFVPWQ